MNNQSSLSLWFMLVFKRDLILSFKKKSSFLIPFIFFHEESYSFVSENISDVFNFPNSDFPIDSELR